MKARLKNSEEEKITTLSQMQTGQFAVALTGVDKGNIIYRPKIIGGLFAVDLTNGNWWKELSNTRFNDFQVRILEAGETIEITE